MGVLTDKKEYHSSRVPPERLFRALVLDGHNLIPRVAPNAVKSGEILEGDGGAGTIKLISFAHGTAKHRTEAIDKDNLAVTFSLIEGDALSDSIEKITYHNKFVAAPGGGTIIKSVENYLTIGDIDHVGITGLKHLDNVKQRKDMGFLIFKAVEKYLLENPNAYN